MRVGFTGLTREPKLRGAVVPHVRCPTCELRFYAAASHSSLVSCPDCEAVLSASQPGDVNAWLARRIMAELPARQGAQARSSARDRSGVNA